MLPIKSPSINHDKLVNQKIRILHPLLEFFSQFNQLIFLGLNWLSDEGNDPYLVILALPVMPGMSLRPGGAWRGSCPCPWWGRRGPRGRTGSWARRLTRGWTWSWSAWAAHGVLLSELCLFVLFMWRLFVECRLPNYFINYNARRGRDLNLKWFGIWTLSTTLL